MQAGCPGEWPFFGSVWAFSGLDLDFVFGAGYHTSTASWAFSGECFWCSLCHLEGLAQTPSPGPSAPAPCRDGRSPWAPALRAVCASLRIRVPAALELSYWVPLGCCSGNAKIRKSLLDSWWIYGYCPVLQLIPRAGDGEPNEALGGGGTHSGGLWGTPPCCPASPPSHPFHFPLSLHEETPQFMAPLVSLGFSQCPRLK